MKIALPVALLIVSAIPCYAEPRAGSGNGLLEVCQLQTSAAKTRNVMKDAERVGYCFGFVTAILAIGRTLPDDVRICAPPEATLGQAVALFVKFLKANPEQTHIDAATLAVVAFNKAWSCK